jgi:hypothetical protein
METGISWTVARGQQTLHSLDGNWKELDRGTWSTDSSQSEWKLEGVGTWHVVNRLFTVWMETGRSWTVAISNLHQRPVNKVDSEFQFMKSARCEMVYFLC